LRFDVLHALNYPGLLAAFGGSVGTDSLTATAKTHDSFHYSNR